MVIRTDPRNIIIIVLALIVFFAFDGCNRVVNLFSGEEVVKEKTTIKIDTSVVKRSYRDIQPFPDIFKPTSQKIRIKDGKVTEVPNSTPIDSAIEKVNKYELVNKLENGTIKSKLLIRGDLLSSEYELTTSDTLITKETTTIRTIVKSGLLGVIGSTVGLDGRIKDIHGGFQYNHKGKWHFKIAPQYDVDPKINLPIKDRAGVMLEVGFNF